jgi:hypothetical protein
MERRDCLDVALFQCAVWASLALCVFYSLGDHLPRYRTEAIVASSSSDALAVVGKPHPAMPRHGVQARAEST